MCRDIAVYLIEFYQTELFICYNTYSATVPKLIIMTNCVRRGRRPTEQSQTNRSLIFKKGIQQLLATSTVHGLNHLSSVTSKYQVILWLALFFSGIAGFITNISFIIGRYVSKPILTSQFVEHEPFVWPDITLCNAMAPYVVHLEEREKKWRALRDEATEVAQKIDSNLFEIIDLADAAEVTIQSLMYSTLDPHAFGVGHTEEMINFMGIDVGHHGIRLTVEIDGNLTSVEVPVRKITETIFLQKRYNVPCYMLKISRIIDKTLYNRLENIAMGINFNFDSYLLVNSSYSSPMIDLFVSSPDEIPHQDPLEILPGYNHRVEISMTRLKREESKIPCRTDRFNVQLYNADLTAYHNVTGSASLCRQVVSQHLYLKSCHCYCPFLPYPVFVNQPLRLCFNMSVYHPEEINNNAKCMAKVYEEFKLVEKFTEIPEANACSRFDSLPVCEDIEYRFSDVRRTAMVELWSENFNDARAEFLRSVYQSLNENSFKSHKANANVSVKGMLKYLRNNFATLTLHRKNKFGALVKQELEYPISELLSDVGGLMGLWIGISVIGLFEILELVYYIMHAGLGMMLRDKKCQTRDRNSDEEQRNYKSNNVEQPESYFEVSPQRQSIYHSTMDDRHISIVSV